MNPNDDAKDEEKIRALLARAQSDAALPDADTLASLRTQSSEAFAAAAPVQRARYVAPFRRPRWLAAAAALIVIGVGLYFWLTPGPSLGQALATLDNAETLHVRYTSHNKQHEFWHTRQPNRSRWDHLEGGYEIADEAHYWNVSEKENRWRHSKRAPNKATSAVLALVSATEHPSVLAARPVERLKEGGQDLLVYRVDVKFPDDPMSPDYRLEAHVDARTLRLHFIRTSFLQADGALQPRAELAVLAYDEPIAAEKFAIADTLTADGRIGKVTDVQGIVSIRPVLHERWTPVREHLVLRPGDWVRTDARGANATALRLVKQTGIILGPKTLVELISPKQIRLIEGEIEITPSKGASVELFGPGADKIAIKERKFYRVEKQQLAQAAKDPPWLLGFKGATGNETLGSLVALVDGRNEPLSVGYHKVTVDIRDQIARTVIEESFVNHTKAELEGIFYFPLPADASISGFGMWIGDNLVEADVVEKQRAREIYETFLRERRDPGLLEWSGGNIFKARVFPIPARSEKRIKISYTQVLPLKGSRYRYSYALQSELLQQHPLRDLSIDVKVNSVVPLRSVHSPTHPTRHERTAHSGQVEFSAQEYTPTRDFEVVIETEGRQADVVMIPHRRGDDGYFMLQLTPPGSNGDWDRPLLPNGDPLNLLILADTSASIDGSQRATQATFVGSILSALTPKDTFNFATCDVTCDWVFAQAKEADAQNVSAARDFLAKRGSLGWSNLDAAFAAALKQCGPKTHVIYLGDGIVTTDDADPVAFSKRLRRTAAPQGATFHAVTLGSSSETGVMKTIASLGGGSMRKITSEQGPAVVARELLAEIAQPALRDVKVEFKGLRAARVYPETLANVPAGSQQILLGRYLPEGKDQTGEVIVTGTQGGKPVRFITKVSLKDAEAGNSFIPRLWARMHLDSLLDQGSSETIKDEIIALSEEFNIITPYTSLLVLETDADRERFKVKRRFQMRDGERFFADGRDNAVFDLAQKQMKKAGAWRTALRRSVLGELARLGREPRLFQPHRPYGRLGRVDVWNFRTNEDRLGEAASLPDGGSVWFGGLEGAYAGVVPVADLALGLDVFSRDEMIDNEEEAFAREEKKLIGKFAKQESRLEDLFEERDLAEPLSATPGFFGGAFSEYANGLVASADSTPYYGVEALDFKSISEPASLLAEGSYRSRGQYSGQWLNTLFPPLPPTPRKTKEPKSTWPAAAHALAQSLLRTDALAKMKGGLEIVRQTESNNVRWDELSSRSKRLELIAAKSWLTRASSDGGQTLVSWCDGNEIGVYSEAFQLGRVRAAVPLDVQPPPLELNDHSLSSLERAYPAYTPTVEPQGKDRTLLVLKHADSPQYETRVLIDTNRHVILSMEDRFKDKVTGTTRFDDFVEAAGSWWARRIESTDEAGMRLSLVTHTINELTLAQHEQQTKAELAGRAQVQLLRLPLPSVAQAKKAAATGKASFDDQFVLLLHFQGTQQWARVLDHLRETEKQAAGKPGLRWLRSAILRDSRRHEELRQRYQEDAGRLIKQAPTDAYFLATYLVGQSSGILQANEMLRLLDAVQPLYDKQPKHVHARKAWRQMRVSYLLQAGQSEEALRLQKQLATDYPRDYSTQQRYAQALVEAGDHPAAYAWLDRVLVREAKWLDWEKDSLRETYTGFLRQQGRYADLVKYLAAWIAQDPPSRSAYEQYLSALIKADQIEKAVALALAWLKDAQVKEELSPPVASRLYAAVNLMLGNGYNLHTNRVEERWLPPLSEAVMFFARHETHGGTAQQILSAYSFQRSEEAPRVRKKLANILSAEIDKLPAVQVNRLAELVHVDDADAAAWTKIEAALRERWLKEAKDETKHVLGQALLRVLSLRIAPTELLAFLRLQWQKGPPKRHVEYADQLFERLLVEPWTAEIESEVLSLFTQLSEAEEPGSRLHSAVAALHRLSDGMLRNRITAEMKRLEHPEKLTRTELLKKQADIRRLAREGLADRLRKESAKQPQTLSRWLLAESQYLDVPLDRNLKQIAAETWEHLNAAPPKKADDEVTIERALDEALRQRQLTTLMNLAARKGAEQALIERLGKYVDQKIDAPGKDASDANRWRAVKYRLLVALDRSKDLEQTLGLWTRVDDPDNRWRVALAYLLAEQGRLPEAIREFEAVESADELSPSAYRSLSDWYLVQKQRDASERAALAVYQTTDEYRLSRMISVKLQPWQRGDKNLPTELDKEVLRMLAVLFDKSASPQSFLYQLQQFYQASHDFRLLSGLPDAVVGHSAARVYPFVEGMQSILEEVRDEATADEIVKRIAEVRPRAKTDVDKRALDMLEVLVERRAAELLNQPGPHRDKALAALVRVSKGEWGPGEPRLMADFLNSLVAPFRETPREGQFSNPEFAAEQLRQLKALHGMAPAGTIDRLHIGYRHASTLRSYKRNADAIDLLQAGLDEFQFAHDGVLPVSANDALSLFIVLLEDAGHFSRGEKVLLSHLKNPVHAQQRRWLVERLDQLYHNALQRDGDTSLGKGDLLYQALHRKIQKDFIDTDQNHRYQLFSLLCAVYRTAHNQKRPSAVEHLKTFAFQAAPAILKEQTSNHDSLVSTLAQTLRDVSGPRDGIEFLLNQIEAEPRWLGYNNQDGWSRHGGTLADWRREVMDLGAAEGRLLKLVLTELRRDLERREARDRSIYQISNSRFWQEKTGEFLKTAEAVLAERSKSGASVQYIADYLYWGLGKHDGAIEVLFAAHKQKLLDDAGQAKLVDFLHRTARFAESIPLLQPLVERRPTNLDYRVLLMHAYFRTTRQGDLLGLLKQTDAFFHEKDRWTENVLGRLAKSTLQNELYEQSVAYSKELIPLHERTQPNRGVGNGTLAGYYTVLADAYAGLKKTPEAVDAAGAAIVVWGQRNENRAQALDTLKKVLLKSPDLDAYARHLDQQKQDSAIVRKALGEAYQTNKEHAKAIVQLKKAAELQSNDAEIFTLLIASLDEVGDKEGAIQQLLSGVQLLRRDLKLYQELGKRYADVGKAEQAERAYTSIVEMLPTEAESHALLAEIREKQNRWPEAIQHWEQVSRLRALEPTGLLKLAAAQIHEKQWKEAAATLRKLDSRSWPPRFSDVRHQVRALEDRLEEERKK